MYGFKFHHYIKKKKRQTEREQPTQATQKTELHTENGQT